MYYCCLIVAGIPLAGFPLPGAGSNAALAANAMRLPGQMATTCVLLISNLNEEVSNCL